MKYILFLLPIVFTHLFGFFDAAQTARKDYPYKDNAIWNYIKQRGEKYQLWYLGGNDNYPPGNPFKCDFWHFAKHCWTFCISMIALSAVLVAITYPSYWLILYGFLYGVEGLTFSFYYSFVFRTDHNWKWYLNYLVHPWEKQ